MAVRTAPMHELALYAGAGGGLLATKWLLGFRTVCYVEIEPYCVDVLKQRIAEGLLHDAPIWDDAKTFDGRPWRGQVDVITSGIPCTPFSVAGLQLAEDDERNMWPETIRIVREVRPHLVFIENVPGIVYTGYVFTVLQDLREAGYKAFPPLRLGAGDVGAGHRRWRIWVVAWNTHCESKSAVGEV